MSVWGVLTVDVDVDANHRTLPYFHFFNFFGTVSRCTDGTLFFSAVSAVPLLYYFVLYEELNCSRSRTIEMQLFISEPCWFPVDDHSHFYKNLDGLFFQR